MERQYKIYFDKNAPNKAIIIKIIIRHPMHEPQSFPVSSTFCAAL